MENSKVNAVLAQYKDLIPSDQVLILKNALVKADDDCYDNLVAVTTKSPITTLLFSIFLGGIGVDRFYVGDTGLGIAKLLLGGFTLGIWPLVDIFCSYKKAKTVNLQKLMLALN